MAGRYPSDVEKVAGHLTPHEFCIPKLTIVRGPVGGVLRTTKFHHVPHPSVPLEYGRAVIAGHACTNTVRPTLTTPKRYSSTRCPICGSIPRKTRLSALPSHPLRSGRLRRVILDRIVEGTQDVGCRRSGLLLWDRTRPIRTVTASDRAHFTRDQSLGGVLDVAQLHCSQGLELPEQAGSVSGGNYAAGLRDQATQVDMRRSGRSDRFSTQRCHNSSAADLLTSTPLEHLVSSSLADPG